MEADLKAYNRRRLLAAGGAILVGGAIASPIAFRKMRALPSPYVLASNNKTQRLIQSNGIPAHSTGDFPNSNDPFAISAQTHAFTIPLDPVANTSLTPIVHEGFWNFGVALNGVPFDPAGPFWKGDPATGWQFEVMSTQARPFLGLDQNNAHVQPGGGYHYHGIPHGLIRHLALLQPDMPAMLLLGYSADGFPVYAPLGHAIADDPHSPLIRLTSGYRIKPGFRQSGPKQMYDGFFVQDYEFIKGAGDLDAANGRFGVTPQFPQGTYYYALTDMYPFIPRLFRGTPDRSFRHSRGPGLGEVPPPLRDFPKGA